MISPACFAESRWARRPATAGNDLLWSVSSSSRRTHRGRVLRAAVVWALVLAQVSYKVRSRIPLWIAGIMWRPCRSRRLSRLPEDLLQLRGRAHRGRGIREEVLLLSPRVASRFLRTAAGVASVYLRLLGRELGKLDLLDGKGDGVRAHCALRLGTKRRQAGSPDRAILGSREELCKVIGCLAAGRGLGHAQVGDRQLVSGVGGFAVMAALQLSGEGELVLALGSVVVILDSLAAVPFNVLNQTSRRDEALIAARTGQVLLGSMELAAGC